MTSPWVKNPVGEVLCSLFMGLIKRFDEPDPHTPLVPPDPIIRTPIFRFCRECKTGTEHTVYDWVDEGIETEECTECQTTKLIP